MEYYFVEITFLQSFSLIQPATGVNIYYFQTEFGIEIYRILHSSRDNVQIFDDSIDGE